MGENTEHKIETVNATAWAINEIDNEGSHRIPAEAVQQSIVETIQSLYPPKEDDEEEE